jgi:hypothetical protein
MYSSNARTIASAGKRRSRCHSCCCSSGLSTTPESSFVQPTDSAPSSSAMGLLSHPRKKLVTRRKCEDKTNSLRPSNCLRKRGSDIHSPQPLTTPSEQNSQLKEVLVQLYKFIKYSQPRHQISDQEADQETDQETVNTPSGIFSIPLPSLNTKHVPIPSFPIPLK